MIDLCFFPLKFHSPLIVKALALLEDLKLTSSSGLKQVIVEAAAFCSSMRLKDHGRYCGKSTTSFTILICSATTSPTSYFRTAPVMSIRQRILSLEVTPFIVCPILSHYLMIYAQLL